MTFLRTLISIFVFFISLTSVARQQDTIWLEGSGVITSQRYATHYRLNLGKTKGGYNIKEFYTSGSKRMEGVSLYPNEPFYTMDGWASWYLENGNINHKSLYDSGKLQQTIYYLHGEKFDTLYYKDNQPSRGRALHFYPSSNYYLMIRYKDNSLHSTWLFEKPDGIRFGYTISVNNEGDSLRLYEFYDEKGKLLGEFQCLHKAYDSFSITANFEDKEGSYVEYYTNPMRVNKVSNYKDDKLINYDRYYRKGALKEALTVEGDSATIRYYKSDGKLIGKLSGVFNPRYDALKRSSYNGTKVEFYSDSNSAVVREIKDYSDGKRLKVRSFSREGAIDQIIAYSGNSRTEQYFDERGALLNEITYLYNRPQDGTRFIEMSNRRKRKETYKEGELIELVEFYKTGEKFKHKKGTKEKYYSKHGKIIAKAKYESFQSDEPLDGNTLRLSNGKLYNEKTYADGELVKRVTYSDCTRPDCTTKEVKYYENGYTARFQIYNSLDELQLDKVYGEDRKRTTTYYDKDGDVIGELIYDSGKKTGTDVNFYYKSDLINTVTTYDEHGEVSSKKRYAKADDKSEPTTYLEASINYNGMSKYYRPDGSLMAEAEFRNGKPYSGMVVEYPSAGEYHHVVTPFEKGKKHGTVRSFKYPDHVAPPVLVKEEPYKNGKRYGTYKTFYISGDVKTIRNYKNDKLHGESIFYDKDGNVEKRYSYRNGNPYDGTFISENKMYADGFTRVVNTKTITCKYSSGTLVFCNIEINGELVEKTTSHNEKYKTVVYDSTGAPKQTLLLDKDKNGTITYHSRKSEEGVIKDGKPVSGTFYFSEFSDYDLREYGDAKLVKVVFATDAVALTALNAEGKALFEFKEEKSWEESKVISRWIWPEEYLSIFNYYGQMPMQFY